MSESEQREIESIAFKYSKRHPQSESLAAMEGYIAGATAMAEKKNLEVKVWKNTAGEFKKYNDELKQQAVFADEIQNQLQTRIEQDIAQLEAAQEELKAAEGVVSTLQAELERVKAVAKDTVIYLQQFDTQEWFDVFGDAKNDSIGLQN